MVELIFTGHLGTDAQVINNVIRLRVAVRDYRKVNGERVDSTQWITVFSPVDRLKNLVGYLKKGAHVYVCGRPSFSCYSSPVAKTFVPDVSVWLSHIELLSVKSDNKNNAEPF